MKAEITHLTLLGLDVIDDPGKLTDFFNAARRLVANPEAPESARSEAICMARYWKKHCEENGMEDRVPGKGTPAYGWLFAGP